MKTTVISFLNQKGGTGKTTLATNIACGLKGHGYKVLLVDADPQGSTRDWHEKNGASLIPVIALDRETLVKDLEAVKAGYQVVIIDGAGRSARLTSVAVKASDVVLIPVQPSPYDVWATADLVDLVKTRQQVNNGNPKSALVINRVIKNTNIAKGMDLALEEYGFPVLDSRTSQLVIYADSAIDGESVYCSSPNKARDEVEQLIQEIKEKYLNE